jgi:ABC-type polar amino acid transport system ATPase subunit
MRSFSPPTPHCASAAGGRVGDDSAKVVRESDVLNEFLTRETNNGVLVAPVLGESGAGKSHLIRWVNAKIPAKAGRHVIYLQKTQTSLKDVIEALLVDQHDPELDEIRRRVSSLGVRRHRRRDGAQDTR